MNATWASALSNSSTPQSPGWASLKSLMKLSTSISVYPLRGMTRCKTGPLSVSSEWTWRCSVIAWFRTVVPVTPSPGMVVGAPSGEVSPPTRREVDVSRTVSPPVHPTTNNAAATKSHFNDLTIRPTLPCPCTVPGTRCQPIRQTLSRASPSPGLP